MNSLFNTKYSDLKINAKKQVNKIESLNKKSVLIFIFYDGLMLYIQ